MSENRKKQKALFIGSLSVSRSNVLGVQTLHLAKPSGGGMGEQSLGMMREKERARPRMRAVSIPLFRICGRLSPEIHLSRGEPERPRDMKSSCK